MLHRNFSARQPRVEARRAHRALDLPLRVDRLIREVRLQQLVVARIPARGFERQHRPDTVDDGIRRATACADEGAVARIEETGHRQRGHVSDAAIDDAVMG
jgi:hypothetical protein